MIQIKNLVLLTIIGLSIMFAGCTEKTESPEEATPIQPTIVQTPGQTTQTPAAEVPPYQVQVIEAKTVSDCIVSYGQKTACFFVNLEIKNNEQKTYDIKITKDWIATNDARTFERYGAEEVGLLASCERQIGPEFNVNGTSSKNIGLCYHTFKENSDPILNLEMQINKQNQKYKFDLQ